MSYTATQNGVFTVRVFPQTGLPGEYVLRTTGRAAGGCRLWSRTSIPANSAYPTSAVSQILVDLSSAFVTSTVDAADLKINGIGADTVTIVDYNTLLFGVNSPLVDGTYNLAINAGTAHHQPAEPTDRAFTSVFTIDRIPPRIIGAPRSHKATSSTLET